MSDSQRVTKRAQALATACALTLTVTSLPPAAGAAASKIEQQCSTKVAKAAGKLADTIIKGTSKCRNADISGKAIGACPDAKTNDKITKAAAKLVNAAGGCSSVCNISTSIACLEDASCPPCVRPPATGASPFCTLLSQEMESCGGSPLDARFDLADIGFPGAYCESVLGHGIESTDDLAACVDSVVRDVAAAYLANTYAGITNASAISSDAASCLAAAAAASAKVIKTAYKGVSKCRNGIVAGRRLGNPITCAHDDRKLASKLGKAEDKLRSSVAAKCTPTSLLELDLCGNGIGGTTSVEDAQNCLVDLAREASDTTEPPALRAYTASSLIDAAYPPRAVCGDDMINQLPSSHLRLGEECDGTDDAACPGQCLPPGDVFECTCGNIPRTRLIVDADGSETDAGWTGLSHNQDVADLSGFVTSLENCDCSEFTGATCTGTSVDPVCDSVGKQQPACSWDADSPLRCDAVGNADGTDDDRDCAICDAYSANAGAFCRDAGDCQSQCYDAGGVATGPCDQQSDCGAGEICRGRCDVKQHCIKIRDGGPQPVDTAGVAVCTIQILDGDVTGTRNIVTGEHEIFYELFSKIHTGEVVSRPCPVCGGFCVGGRQDMEVCEGRCETSGDPCRFDADCPSGETCAPESPDCPGGLCQLSLVCGSTVSNLDGSTIHGKPCEVTYQHRAFGTLSHDCEPLPGQNFSGPGLEVSYSPTTDAPQSLPAAYPCTSPGFGLYDCPCDGTTGAQTKPNTCAFSCSAAGPDFGVPCADGNTESFGTTCAGGANVGLLCDEDADCPSSSCSANPLHCTGDPGTEHNHCTDNADCGVGTCVDACTGGRCLPLCIPTVSDPFDGECAGGPPLYHCAGEKFVLRSCEEETQGAGCTATCSVSAAACTSDNECPSGQTCEGPCPSHQACEAGDDGVLGTPDDLLGAGACLATPRSCFLDPAPAEGGSTVNGQGDPTNYYTAGIHCQKATIADGINTGAGFPGPNRTRRHGINVVNQSSLP